MKYENEDTDETKSNQEFQLKPQNFEHMLITTTHSNSNRHALLTFESSLLTPSSNMARGDFCFTCMDSAI